MSLKLSIFLFYFLLSSVAVAGFEPGTFFTLSLLTGVYVSFP